MRKTIIFMLAATFYLAGCTPGDNLNVNSNSTNNSNATAAAPSATTTPARGVPPRRDDTTWVTDVAQDGMAEVELARVAAQKAQNPEVKRFAQRMLSDHTKANAELKQLATTKSITLPAQVKPEQKDAHDRLAKMSGAEFDREYMSIMVSDHDKAVTAFQEESQDGSDPELKAWATKTLPTLQEHQRLAREINGKLGT